MKNTESEGKEQKEETGVAEAKSASEGKEQKEEAGVAEAKSVSEGKEQKEEAGVAEAKLVSLEQLVVPQNLELSAVPQSAVRGPGTEEAKAVPDISGRWTSREVRDTNRWLVPNPRNPHDPRNHRIVESKYPKRRPKYKPPGS